MREKFATVPAYLRSLSPEAARVVGQLRERVAAEVPAAREVISYNILAFAFAKPFLYCAGFKGHVGIYPPVRGDARLVKALARYRNEKGSLRFALDEPMPWPLIVRVIRALAAVPAAARGTAAPATPARRRSPPPARARAAAAARRRPSRRP
jgi:uncharacterized protein YdhG (YjbR/CyaY superfamily)